MEDSDDANFPQTAPLPSGRHSTRFLVVLPIHTQLRDVKEILAQRGINVSYETVRAWTVKFDPKIAANLRRRKQPPSPRWRLDELVSMIAGENMWLRCAADEEQVMDMIVQKSRDAGAALRFLRRLLKNQNVEPETIVTDGLLSYRAAIGWQTLFVCPGEQRGHGEFS